LSLRNMIKKISGRLGKTSSLPIALSASI
jgi:hypothetical protein